jgi:uncharacterized protein YecE (DUF72 family)
MIRAHQRATYARRPNRIDVRRHGKARAEHDIKVVRFAFPYMAAKREGQPKPPDREPVLRETWFQVIEQLGPRQLVIGGKPQTEPVDTESTITLRLRRSSYSSAMLKKWVKQVRQQDWQDVFAFFKHEDEAKGPRFAKRFLKLAT